MTLSVIIPCYNAADTICTQLEALSKQEWPEPWEIVVSENGSTDGTRSLLENFQAKIPTLRIVDSSDRRGPAHARNIAMREATGDAFLFCDSDDEVAPGWLNAMGEALRKHEFVACRIESSKLNEAWVCDSRARTQRDGLQRLSWSSTLHHAGGGTLGFRRSVFETVGGFDESLPRTMDTEYCVRVQLAGIKLHFVPEATVHVRFQRTLRSMFSQARTFGEYSVLVYKKARAYGLPGVRRPWHDGATAWADVLLRLPEIRTKGEWANWVFQFGYRIGRLRGSIKHRVVVP